MIISLYLFLSYMIVLGMIIEEYEKKTIPMDTWVVYIFSPIIFPIFIGMMLSEKSKNVKEDE
jgi:hypothetical protein